MSITFNKLQTGLFQVYLDNKPTVYFIFNGSMGLSGKGSNEYGIENTTTGKRIKIGSLQKAKKTVTYWITGK